ncbi:hypothetical protein BH09MYX1_BH09MYX1_10830 [soil metagenome]
MMLRVLLPWLSVASAILLACSPDPDCAVGPPPPIREASIHSGCGFATVTSTCTGFSGYVASSCTGECAIHIAATKAETCHVEVVYGNGATARTELTFGEGSECDQGGFVFRGASPILPPLCASKDAGNAGDAPLD